MAKQIYVDGELEDWSQADWEDYLEERAEKIAEERIKLNRKLKVTPREGDLEKYAKEYKRRMLRDYPFDKLDDRVYAAFENLGNESAMQWLDGWKDKDPMVVKANNDFKEWSKYLKGIAAEGEDWFSMTPQQLKDVAATLDDGTGKPYDISTKEGYADFMKRMGDYQNQLDRANLVKEMDDIPGSTLTKIAYPSLYKGIENAVAGGEDLSKAQAVGLGLMDAGVNVGQFMAPSINALRARPVLNSILDAGIQGGLELGRQGMGYGVADIEPDMVAAPVTSLTAGLTRPAMFGTAQGLMGGMTGPEWMKFRRGMMASTRAGNPVVAERTALGKNIDNYNKGVLRDMENAWKAQAFARTEPGDVISDTYLAAFKDKGVNKWLDLVDKDAALQANLAPKLRETFDRLGMGMPLVDYSRSGLGKYKGMPIQSDNVFRKVFPKRFNPGIEAVESTAGEPLFIDKEAMLKLYDNMHPVVNVNTSRGITKVNNTLPEGAFTTGGKKTFGKKTNGKGADTEQVLKLSGKDESAIRSLIPNKMAEQGSMDAKYKLGLALGTGVNDFGGRFEPTFKFNLLNPLKDSPFKDDKEAYKKSEWYRNMSSKSRKIIDEAFKEKQEDEEE